MIVDDHRDIQHEALWVDFCHTVTEMTNTHHSLDNMRSCSVANPLLYTRLQKQRQERQPHHEKLTRAAVNRARQSSIAFVAAAAKDEIIEQSHHDHNFYGEKKSSIGRALIDNDATDPSRVQPHLDRDPSMDLASHPAQPADEEANVEAFIRHYMSDVQAHMQHNTECRRWQQQHEQEREGRTQKNSLVENIRIDVHQRLPVSYCVCVCVVVWFPLGVVVSGNVF